MITKIKGTRDFFDKEADKIREVEEIFINLFKSYSYKEIKTPTFEKTSLFQRGVGDGSDIVRKEMFSVISSANLIKYKEGNYDLEKNSMTLKPEGTAPVVRAFIENKLYALVKPIKVFYIDKYFRNERPQAGRYREFSQLGVEIFGSEDPYCDAEIIMILTKFLDTLKIKEYNVLINSIGCSKCRESYNKKLYDFLSQKKDNLCNDCNDRMNRNILRVIDCKNSNCKKTIEGYPKIIDNLCEDCNIHFTRFKSYLDKLNIDYKVDHSIVRGLDYYTKTAFEITTDLLGAQSAIAGGGRYDGLIKSLDGPDEPGVGFGAGFDRVVIAAEKSGFFNDEKQRNNIFFAYSSENEKLRCLEIINKLNQNNIVSELDLMNRSFKSALKYADKENYKYICLVGENELKNETITLRNLDSSTQSSLTLDELIVKLGDK